jgi:CO dehydrogenase/acetyl-CoA synthase beta subunit
MYKSRPWINGLIKKTYISKVLENSILDFNNYIVTTDNINMENKTWYSVNDNFFNLETNQLIKKRQESNILSFYDKDNTLVLQVNLAFLMEDNSFIIQDERIYDSEKSYLDIINGKLNEHSVKNMSRDLYQIV